MNLKRSLIVSLVLLVFAGATISWRHRHLLELRKENRRLVEESLAMRVRIHHADPSLVRSVTKRVRENQEAKIHEVIAEWRLIQKESDRSSDALQQRVLAFYEKLDALDGKQLLMLYRKLESDPADKEQVAEFSRTILEQLGRKDPQTALRLIGERTQSGNPVAGDVHLVRDALQQWASADPTAAYRWCQSHGKGRDVELVYSALRGAMEKSPAAAFQLIQEIPADIQQGVSGSLLDLTKTPEARLETLSYFQEILHNIQGDDRAVRLDRAMSSFSYSISQEKDGIDWINKMQLAPDEKKQLAQHLSYYQMGDRTGEWLGWVAGNLSTSEAKQPIRNMITEWAKSDYQAVATWLNQSPAGPTKNIAVRQYAETVVEYDPEGAIQWADTLPEGKDQTSTYKAIFKKWPKDDPVGKAAFGDQHGLK